MRDVGEGGRRTTRDLMDHADFSAMSRYTHGEEKQRLNDLVNSKGACSHQLTLAPSQCCRSTGLLDERAALAH